MWRALIVATLAIAVVACGGSATRSERPIERIANPTEQAQADEAEIGDVLDQWGEAFSKEKWSDIYKLLPPSMRDECPRGRFLLMIEGVALVFSSGVLSDETMDALKEDAADGLDVRALEIIGDFAVADTLEFDEFDLRREDGRWWVTADDPCDRLSFEEERERAAVEAEFEAYFDQLAEISTSLEERLAAVDDQYREDLGGDGTIHVAVRFVKTMLAANLGLMFDYFSAIAGLSVPDEALSLNVELVAVYDTAITTFDGIQADLSAIDLEGDRSQLPDTFSALGADIEDALADVDRSAEICQQLERVAIEGGVLVDLACSSR